MNKTILSIREVCYAYQNGRDFTFEKVSFEIPQNSITSILGRNGAGKTTLLLILLELIKPQKGEVLYYGNYSDEWDNRYNQKIAYLPQFESAPAGMMVADYLLMGRIPYISPFLSPNKGDVALVEKYAKLIKIDHLLSFPLGKISGGELQRVRFCRGLVQESDLILLDEPITHLDLNAKYSMLELMQALKEMGKTIIFTTHDPVEAVKISDYALLIGTNHQIEFGKREDILTDRNLSDCFGLPIRIITSGKSISCVVDKL